MENHPFVPGKDWVYYSRAIYGENEISKVVKALNEDWLGVGKYTCEFEEKIAKVFGQSFGLFVNSGSSANWLAVRALRLPPGGEVITPACTFSTTVNPLLELGLIPVFIDVELDTYNINLDLIEDAITPATTALMIPHLVGNLNDTKRLRHIADKHGLMLIEDSCDTIGGTIRGEPTGKYTDVSTTSFYASHIITAMGGGGMVMFKDAYHTRLAQALRDWGRASAEYYDEHPSVRFDFFLDDVQYDGKFVFYEVGFNFKSTEINAAFGLTQFSRLGEFHNIRKKNFQAMYNIFGSFPDHFILPRQTVVNSDVHWLAFPVTIKQSSPINRTDFMKYLESKKIQTRMLFAGNILRHPPYRDIPHRVVGGLDNSDRVLKHSMLLGCHHGLREEHLGYISYAVREYMSQI